MAALAAIDMQRELESAKTKLQFTVQEVRCNRSNTCRQARLCREPSVVAKGPIYKRALAQPVRQQLLLLI